MTHQVRILRLLFDDFVFVYVSMKQDYIMSQQGSTKTVFNSLELLDVPVRQANSIGPLPTGQENSKRFMARLNVDQTLG